MSVFSWTVRSVLRSYLTILAVFLAAALPLAHTWSEGQARELETDKRQKLDVVLVLDGSGSMLLTDPLRLRYEGAKLFLSFLSADDRVAIISFAESAKVVRPLLPYDPAQTDQLSKTIDGIPSEGRYTDLYAALEGAKKLLKDSPRDDARSAILLLSDGKMEPEPAQGSPAARSSQLMEQLVPEMKAAGLAVYTMALSDQADKELLSEIASAVDGVTWYTPNADIIHESFADLFLAVKKPQVVPLTSKGFHIDSDVEEATFYVNRVVDGKVLLKSPQGEEYSASRHPADTKWFSGQNFDVITIGSPEEGDWSVEGVEAGDGFATVLTNLKLVTDWPATIRAEEPALVQARLYEGEKPVSLPEMSGAVKFVFQVISTDKISTPLLREAFADDGTSGDEIEKDGIFSHEVTIREPGEYKLTVIADGPTFRRTQQIPFRVKPQLVRLELAEVEEAEHEQAEHGADPHEPSASHEEHGASGEHESEHHEEHQAEGHADEHADGHVEQAGAQQFNIKLSAEVSGFKQLEVQLFAVDAARRKYNLPLVKSSKDPLLYTCLTTKLPKPGEYQLKAEMKGKNKKRESIQAESHALTFTLPEGSATEVVELVDVEHTKEVPVSSGTSPILYIILITLLNAGLGGAGYWFLKNKSGGSSKVELDPSFAVDVSKVVRELEEKALISEVDINDPNMSDDQEVVGGDAEMMKAE